MPAVPLHVRVPIEYGVVMAVSLATAWVYSAYARADFRLALVLGLASVLAFWLLMQIWPKTRGKGIHALAVAALAATLFVIAAPGGI